MKNPHQFSSKQVGDKLMRVLPWGDDPRTRPKTRVRDSERLFVADKTDVWVAVVLKKIKFEDPLPVLPSQKRYTPFAIRIEQDARRKQNVHTLSDLNGAKVWNVDEPKVASELLSTLARCLVVDFLFTVFVKGHILQVLHREARCDWLLTDLFPANRDVPDRDWNDRFSRYHYTEPVQKLAPEITHTGLIALAGLPSTCTKLSKFTAHHVKSGSSPDCILPCSLAKYREKDSEDAPKMNKRLYHKNRLLSRLKPV